MTMPNLSFFNTTLKDLDKFYVGFDDQFNRIAKMQEDMVKNMPTFPFYNIKKTDNTKYQIQLALAGWSTHEIDIELDGDKLVIKGNVQDNQDEQEEYFFKGISKRAFTRTFMLDDQVVVHGAEFINGILSVILERITPEQNKPKKIEINSGGQDNKSKRQLLVD